MGKQFEEINEKMDVGDNGGKGGLTATSIGGGVRGLEEGLA